jgi:hypothetical protein
MRPEKVHPFLNFVILYIPGAFGRAAGAFKLAILRKSNTRMPNAHIEPPSSQAADSLEGSRFSRAMAGRSLFGKFRFELS